jgi:uncharacterized membrane protein YsdA (DUF1294 family)
MKYFLLYLAVISVVSVLVCCYDKIAAKKCWRRTPEKTLLLLSVLGGSAAMYLTMQIIRHKTRHNKFMVGIPLIILLQIAIIWVVYFKIL